MERGLAKVQVTLHVLYHYDRIVHHQTYREHDRKQGQEVNGEPRCEHQEHGPNQ